MKEKIKKVEDQINIIWNEVVNDLCNNTGVYSSEKSVVFNFALKFSKWAENHKHSNIRFDFERDMFKKDFSGGKFLDLYIEYDEVKIGLEFKYPKSTEKIQSSSLSFGKSSSSIISQLGKITPVTLPVIPLA